ncbi:MAG: acyltransferase [Nocardioides sp.]|uniref:acyltransferase family protein n=1 Tax=Nocardioides sp. TaxID=35761 RepID=UPI002391A22E|nr:acyltransferase [Nocardioides sp.]MDE0775701.1 acyltransferase [Nocardioides sp.]
MDALRAVAVMLVVVMHAGLTVVPGDGGVVVFFVISGFIITSVLIRELEVSGSFRPRRFYLRRGLKLGPPLALLVVVPTLVYAAFRPVSWTAVLSQVGFSYNWYAVAEPESAEQVLPGSDVVWSLAIEEQFYIVFAVLWIGLVRTRRWRALTAVVAGTVMVCSFATRWSLVGGLDGPARNLDPAVFNHVYRGTDTRVEAIALGVLLALALDAHARGRLPALGWLSRDTVLLAAGLLFAASSVVFRNDWSEVALRPTTQGLCAALVIGYGLMPTGSAVQRRFYRLAGARWVQLVGLASYSIYLVHFPLIELVGALAPDAPPGLQLALNITLGVGVGALCYRFVEVPVLQWRQRRGL